MNGEASQNYFLKRNISVSMSADRFLFLSNTVSFLLLIIARMILILFQFSKDKNKLTTND